MHKSDKINCHGAAIAAITFLLSTILPMQSSSAEILTYCQRYARYDAACKPSKPKKKQPSQYNRSKLRANSRVILCNGTRHTVTMSFVYEQYRDRKQFRANQLRHRSGGWLRLSPGDCDSGFELGQRQWISLAFKKAGKTEGLKLWPDNYPIQSGRRIETICVDMIDRFDFSSNNLRDLTSDCRTGLQKLKVSFSIRGGTNNFRLNLIEVAK